jgi:hypothetical protein
MEADRSQRDKDFFRKKFFMEGEFLSEDASRARMRIQRQALAGLGWRDSERGGMKLRRAAAKLPLEPHEYAQSPKAEARMLSASSEESRRSVAVSVCSTWARFPARVALYYY